MTNRSPELLHVTGYGGWMLAGVVVTALVWARAARRDARLPLIYFAALLGALVGAKIVYLLAEGWNDLGRPDQWLRWATGKSVLGSLLFGYAAVEWAKKSLGYTAATGDWFAVVAPVGIGLGRLGCWVHGCCAGRVIEPSWYAVTDAAGVTRWPAVPLELGFNAVALVGALVLKAARLAPGQHFHLYLIAYGVFRFLHEFERATPRCFGGYSGYQIAALAVAGLGGIRWAQRQRASRAAASGMSPVREDGPGTGAEEGLTGRADDSI